MIATKTDLINNMIPNKLNHLIDSHLGWPEAYKKLYPTQEVILKDRQVTVVDFVKSYDAWKKVFYTQDSKLELGVADLNVQIFRGLLESDDKLFPPPFCPIPNLLTLCRIYVGAFDLHRVVTPNTGKSFAPVH